MSQQPVKIGHYRLGRTLGVGSFGKVKLAEHELTGHKVAVKILNRNKIKSLDMDEKVRREINILKLFMHPHVIRLYEVIDTPTDIFMIMEYVSGGELFEYIVSHGRLSEDGARRFFQQIISGVDYCHKHMVVHRDLKPENLLLDSSLNVKIADFGLSNMMKDGEFLKTSCGSPNYAAPEVISGKMYGGAEVDVWSCGVILYAALCGSLPFDDETIPNLFRKIKSGVYVLPKYLSESSRDLIPRMLVVDPVKRITIDEIRNHPWFNQSIPPYLSLTPEETIAAVQTIDQEVLEQVEKKVGFAKDKVTEAVNGNHRNQLTVAYFLMLDNKRRQMSNLGLTMESEQPEPEKEKAEEHFSDVDGERVTYDAEMSDSEESKATPEVKPEASNPGLADHSLQRKWHLGLTTNKAPADIMGELYKTLKEHGFDWKTSSPYQVKCRVLAPNSESKYIKIGIQLFEVNMKEGTYLIDLRKLEGNVCPFMDKCAELVGFLKENLDCN